MKQITVLFFATLRERAQRRQITLQLEEEALVADLKKKLADQFPELGSYMDSVLVSINKEYGFDQDPIPDNAEVALFPQVSGGAKESEIQPDELPTVFEITEKELPFDELLARITLPTTGAACVFTGMVRALTLGDDTHQTSLLEYEAYIPMAEIKMRQVANEIRQKWPAVRGIAIVQRIGRLYPGTPTVMVACTAGHRDSGVFEAARYGIDRLKQIVPIWKKEVGPDGEIWVEGDYVPDCGD
jgi:molybdopterin synthase catalytic subunit